MKITENRLRRIIRSIIKENWESDRALRNDFKELFRYLMHHNSTPFGMVPEDATESNMAWAWSELSSDDQEYMYKKLESERSDLIPILKRAMNSSDKVKTRTQKSRDGRFATSSYRGQS